MINITLPTSEDVMKIPFGILRCSKKWWLSSKISPYKNIATIVDEDGMIHSNNEVLVPTGVRPMILFDDVEIIKNLKRTHSGFLIYGASSDGTPYKWIDITKYISKPALLMKECLPEDMIFDKESNVYETSSIKKYLEDTFNLMNSSNIEYQDLVLMNYEWMDDSVIDYEVQPTDNLLQVADNIRKINGNTDFVSDILNEVYYNFYLDLDTVKESVKMYFVCNNGEKDDYETYEIIMSEEMTKAMLWKAIRTYVKENEEERR